MNNHNFNTESLWRMFNMVINTVVIVLILSFGYLLLEKHVLELINKPSFSKDQLEAYSKKRDVVRKQERADNWDLVEQGVHVKTGLKADPNLQLIISKCTSCHSAKLITQNRATRQGWESMIDWMQATQGLTDLGDSEPIVLDYLVKYYSPKEEGRRTNLEIEEIEWYLLNLEEYNTQ